jgi:hypothetical protein
VRSPAIARSASAVFVAGLFVQAMFVVLQTLTLSGAQIADRDLGHFGATVGYGTIGVQPGDARVADDLLRAARTAGATDAMVLLSATDVQVATGRGEVRDVTLQEAPWASRPFPDRYELQSGRWPRRPGEIVVTDTDQDVAAAAGTPLAVLSGGARLQVVGTAEDRYARTSTLLAAPGTWGELPERLVDRFARLQAQPVLYWSGASEARVVAAFAGVARSHAQDGVDVRLEAVAETIMTRDQVDVTREKAWIGRTPAGYIVPSLLLPLAAVALCFGLLTRRFRRTLGVLTSLGVGRAVAVASLSLAAGAWCVVAACAGAVVGTGAGVAGRDLIARLRSAPGGPLSDLEVPLLRLVGVVGLSAACAGLVLFSVLRASRTRRVDRASSEAGRRRVGSARKWLAFAAWCAVVRLSLEVDSPPTAAVLAGVLTVAVVLLVPELVDLLLRALPERGARTRLGRRQLADDRSRVAAAVALLAVVLGGSLGYLTLLDTLITTAGSEAEPDTLPGQLMVMDRASRLKAPLPQLLAAVERSDAAQAHPQLRLRFLNNRDRAGELKDAVSLLGTDENVMAVDSVDRVEQLVAHRLDAAQATTLRRGGMLVWSDYGSPVGQQRGRGRLMVRAGDRLIGRPMEVPLATVDIGRARWRAGTSGVLLTSSAHRLGLPVTVGPAMYTGLSGSQAQAIQEAVIRAGQDATGILRFRQPEPPVAPAALVATAAGLVILALLASLVAIRGQARTLRGYLGRLVAIGLSVRWAQGVLLYQQAVIIGAATVLGLAIAFPPVIVVAAQIEGFTLSVPWTQILVLVSCVYVAMCLAALHATRTLRARKDAYEGV